MNGSKPAAAASAARAPLTDSLPATKAVAAAAEAVAAAQRQPREQLLSRFNYRSRLDFSGAPQLGRQEAGSRFASPSKGRRGQQHDVSPCLFSYLLLCMMSGSRAALTSWNDKCSLPLQRMHHVDTRSAFDDLTTLSLVHPCCTVLSQHTGRPSARCSLFFPTAPCRRSAATA